MCRPVKNRSGAWREEIPGWTAVKDSKAWHREIQIIWPIFGLSWDRGWPLLNWGKFYNISDKTNVCRTPFFLWRKLFMLWSRSLLEIFLWMLRCSKNKNATKKTDKQMDNKGIPRNSKVTNYSIKVQTFRNQEVWTKDLKWARWVGGPRSCRSWRPIQKICNDFYFPCKMKGMQCGESYPNVKCIQGMWRSVAICATKQLPLPFPRQFFMFDSSPLVFYPVGMICLVTMVTSLYQK